MASIKAEDVDVKIEDIDDADQRVLGPLFTVKPMDTALLGCNSEAYCQLNRDASRLTLDRWHKSTLELSIRFDNPDGNLAGSFIVLPLNILCWFEFSGGLTRETSLDTRHFCSIMEDSGEALGDLEKGKRLVGFHIVHVQKEKDVFVEAGFTRLALRAVLQYTSVKAPHLKQMCCSAFSRNAASTAAFGRLGFDSNDYGEVLYDDGTGKPVLVCGRRVKAVFRKDIKIMASWKLVTCGPSPDDRAPGTITKLR